MIIKEWLKFLFNTARWHHTKPLWQLFWHKTYFWDKAKTAMRVNLTNKLLTSFLKTLISTDTTLTAENPN